MLIEFRFGNFKSFRDSVTLSMSATHTKSADKSVDENNLIVVNPQLSLLTSAAIYGANASGKSNLIAAFAFMKRMVLNSSRESQAEEPIDFNPFRLSTRTEDQPGSFEVVFIQKDIKYRYGFEVTQDRIISEWLYSYPTARETRLFTREQDQIEANPRSFKEGRGLESKTRSNALFLSVVAQFNGDIARVVRGWFQNIRFVSGLEDTGYRSFTIDKYLKDDQLHKEILKMICALDLDIQDILIDKIDKSDVKFPKEMPEELKSLVLKSSGEVVSIGTFHKKYNELDEAIGVERFNLDQDESQGTQKLFSLTGPILDVLKNGRVLLIDEMEARMHPLITDYIIRLFNSKASNPKRAQLIFTTHETNLLDRALFRRDQIWFVEKNRMGASHLYSMVEFKPRNDASFEKDYLRGRYGATPFLGDFHRVFEESPTWQVGKVPEDEA